VEFAALAKAFAQPSQATEGSGNTLGWAARDASGHLAPYKFNRRELGANDVMIKITHAGEQDTASPTSQLVSLHACVCTRA
jgi:hypothetical protein